MDTFIELVRNVLGSAVDYFTVGQSMSPQWHYGNLLEYAFSGMVMILAFVMAYKLLITMLGFFARK